MLKCVCRHSVRMWRTMLEYLPSYETDDFYLYSAICQCQVEQLLFQPGMSRKLGPNCGYPQFRVIFAQKLGWCWVVGVNLPKLGSNYPNFTPISPPNCGKIGVVVVGCSSHIDWVGVVVGGVKTSFCSSLISTST